MSLARAVLVSLVLAASACESSPEERDVPSPWERERPSLVLGEGYVLVASAESDTLVALDPMTWATVAMPVPVGRSPFEIDGPSSLAMDREGHVYVLLSRPFTKEDVGPHEGHGTTDDSGWLQRLSTIRGPRVELRLEDQAPLDRAPGVVAVSPRGREVVVSHFDLKKAEDATLAEIDRRADLLVLPGGPLHTELLGRRVRACRAPHGLGFAGAERKRVFVACYGDDTIGDFDLDDPGLLVRRTPIPIGTTGSATRPFALDAPSDGEVVAVGSIGSNEVLALDVGSLGLMWRRPQAGPVGAVAWTTTGRELAVLVQTPPRVEILSRADGASLASSRLPEDCARAETMAWGADGRLLVACAAVGSGGRVYRLSQGSLAATETVALSSRPSALLVMGPP